MNGIINFYKPQHVTSHDCVSIIRRLTGIKRVGHTGTLDPMATGVLPICVGTATRIIDYLDEDEKIYRCTMQLGIETDTQDIWGKTIRETPVENLSPERIAEAVFSFQGEVKQIPPKYSALKVDGKRLYQYARAGQDVVIKPRQIHISKMALNQIQDTEVTFTVTCSKGTYVRTLCQDIGAKLGCGGTMSGLVRLATGMFRIEDAMKPEDLKDMSAAEIMKVLLPVDAPLSRFGLVQLDETAARDFTNGKIVLMEPQQTTDFQDDSFQLIRVYFFHEFIGVGRLGGNQLTADKVFNTRLQHETF